MQSNDHTIEFLVELDDTLIQKILNIKSAKRVANLIQNASTNDQSYILGFLQEEQAQSVIDLLNTEEKEEIEEIMGYPEDSAGSMMATEVFTLYQNTTCGDALKTLQDQQDAEMVLSLIHI